MQRYEHSVRFTRWWNGLVQSVGVWKKRHDEAARGTRYQSLKTPSKSSRPLLTPGVSFIQPFAREAARRGRKGASRFVEIAVTLENAPLALGRGAAASAARRVASCRVREEYRRLARRLAGVEKKKKRKRKKYHSEKFVPRLSLGRHATLGQFRYCVYKRQWFNAIEPHPQTPGDPGYHF